MISFLSNCPLCCSCCISVDILPVYASVSALSSLRVAVRVWSRFSSKSRTKAALCFTRQMIPVLNRTRPTCLDIVTTKLILRGKIAQDHGRQSHGKKRFRILQGHLDYRQIRPRTWLMLSQYLFWKVIIVPIGLLLKWLTNYRIHEYLTREVLQENIKFGMLADTDRGPKMSRTSQLDLRRTIGLRLVTEGVRTRQTVWTLVEMKATPSQAPMRLKAAHLLYITFANPEKKEGNVTLLIILADHRQARLISEEKCKISLLLMHSLQRAPVQFLRKNRRKPPSFRPCLMCLNQTGHALFHLALWCLIQRTLSPREWNRLVLSWTHCIIPPLAFPLAILYFSSIVVIKLLVLKKSTIIITVSSQVFDERSPSLPKLDTGSALNSTEDLSSTGE